jgi:hypothetical protein
LERKKWQNFPSLGELMLSEKEEGSAQEATEIRICWNFPTNQTPLVVPVSWRLRILANNQDNGWASNYRL